VDGVGTAPQEMKGVVVEPLLGVEFAAPSEHRESLRGGAASSQSA
jgi:hypothetical protein